MAIARATGAQMTLLAIEPDLPTGVAGLDSRQVRRQTRTMVGQARDSLAPGARTMLDRHLTCGRLEPAYSRW
jgi:hypothetical protein